MFTQKAILCILYFICVTKNEQTFKDFLDEKAITDKYAIFRKL